MILRQILHRPVDYLRMHEWQLIKRYWRLVRRRNKHKEPGQPDARVRQEYREWLQANNLPATPFNPRAYSAWKRGVDQWTP